MKEREIYSDIRAPPPVIIRLDGRAFHQILSRIPLKRPYDDDFAVAMVEVCRALLTESGFSPVFLYTFSDEISLYLEEIPFDGRVEKLTSVFASYAASAFSMAMSMKTPVAFDARVIPVHSSHIIPYLIWRQDEAWRNHMNAYSQALLIQKGGMSPVVAQRTLNGLGTGKLHEICFQHGVNLAQTPVWQRRGIMLYNTAFTKEGYNPMTGEKTEARRRRVFINRDLPLFSSDEGREFMEKVIGKEL